MPKTQRKNNEYSFQHSKERFFERYSQNLTEKDYINLTNSCRNSVKNKNFLKKEKNCDQYIIELQFNNSPVLAVFDSVRDTITTFIPYNKNKMKNKR